jgi:phenylalanyl-tRNA synthetase beta chain
MELPQAEVARILTALEFECESLGEAELRVTAPLHRLDIGTGITGAADLIEEVARVHGYDRIPTTEMADRLPPQRDILSVNLEERARDLLVSAGLQEVMTYRLTARQREAGLHPGGSPTASDRYVTVANPISADRVVMRQSLLPGLLEVLALNARLRQRLWFFEIGPVFLPKNAAALPDEPRRLAMVLAGSAAPPSWRDVAPRRTDFFDLKGVVEALLEGLHLPPCAFQAADHPSFAPGQTARLTVGDHPAGMLGQLHPRVQQDFDVPAGSIWVAELDLEYLLARIPVTYRVAQVPRFPPVLHDIAVVVDEEVSSAQLIQGIHSAGGPLLAEVRVFDVYRGEPVPRGRKSLAFSLAFQATDRTLTDAEAEAAKSRILEALARRLGARLRA